MYSEEDGEARRLALMALSVGDAAEALRLCLYPTAGSGQAKPWHWLVAARAHYALGDLRASSQALAEAALAAAEAAAAGGDGGGDGGQGDRGAGTAPRLASSIATALVRTNVAAMSLREGKPRCALLCCSLALSEEQQEQQPSSSLSLSSAPSSSSSPSSSALPVAIRAAATYNAALASLATVEEDKAEGGSREKIGRAAAEELEALARSLDESEENEKAKASSSAAPRHAVLAVGRRARARVWLRAAEALARVAAAAAAAAAEEKEEEKEEGLWVRASAAASRAAALSLPPSPSAASAASAASDDQLTGDPRCRAAALALVAASETRLGRVPEAREAIRQALDLGGCVEGSSRKGGGPLLLPGARAALESYLRAMGGP